MANLRDVLEERRYQGPFARSGPPFLHKIFPPIRDFSGRAFSTNVAPKPLETTGICQPSYGLQKLYHLFSKLETFFLMFELKC